MGKRLDRFRDWFAKLIGTHDKNEPANNPSVPPDKTDAKKPAKESTKESGGPPWWVFVIFLIAVISLFVLFGGPAQPYSLSLAALLIAAASISVGGLLGFLFGIPRTPDRSPPRAGEEETSSYNPSNNLEQISDWLTKILIGVGLVELKEIGAILRSIVNIVVSSYKDAPPPGIEIITYVALITFSIFGFLASFLWTRINYGPLQAMTDDGMRRRLKSFEKVVMEKTENRLQETDSRLEEKTSDLTQRVKAVSQRAINQEDATPEERAVEEHSAPSEEKRPEKPLPKDILDRIEEFKKAEDIWNINPTAKLFPDAPSELNGFRLDGKIITAASSYLEIQLTVTRIDNNGIEDQVIFLLHPTFGKSVRHENSRDGVVKLTIRSAGWFTVVAIINETEPTVLSYDLRKLPNVPQWFKES